MISQIPNPRSHARPLKRFGGARTVGGRCELHSQSWWGATAHGRATAAAPHAVSKAVPRWCHHSISLLLSPSSHARCRGAASYLGKGASLSSSRGRGRHGRLARGGLPSLARAGCLPLMVEQSSSSVSLNGLQWFDYNESMQHWASPT
jgi:hypothetical protein